MKNLLVRTRKSTLVAALSALSLTGCDSVGLDLGSVPVIGEYMSRPTVEISEKYGKDLSLVIRFFGSKAINNIDFL